MLKRQTSQYVRRKKAKKRECAKSRYCNLSEEEINKKKRVRKKQISHDDKGMLIEVVDV